MHLQFSKKKKTSNLNFFQVHDGPTYLCHVTGIGVNPGLDFSFDQHDFGACFIYKAGMPINTKSLVIQNKDDKEIRCGTFMML